MRILLTLDRDATKREENDYVQSLIEAGFERGEIEIAEPGTVPEGEFDGLVLGAGATSIRGDMGRRRGRTRASSWMKDATRPISLFSRRPAKRESPSSGSAGAFR